MGINAFHLVLFFVLKCVNVGFYVWHPINNGQIYVRETEDSEKIHKIHIKFENDLDKL